LTVHSVIAIFQPCRFNVRTTFWTFDAWRRS